MDIYALSTPTQIIMAWTLLGVLLTWLVIFASLAFRSRPSKLVDSDDLPTPTGSFPIISVQVMPGRLPSNLESQAQAFQLDDSEAVAAQQRFQLSKTQTQFVWESGSRNMDPVPPHLSQQTLASVSASVASTYHSTVNTETP
jgi:hypothetical protein